MKHYEVHLRQQHSNGSSSHRFGGPDVYVAVTATPDGVECPKYLNRGVLDARGIDIYYFGEGYSKRPGPRSMLGRAIDEAEEFAAWKNKVEEAWACPVR